MVPMVAMGHSMPRIRLGIVTIRATSVGEVRLAMEEVTQGLRAGMWTTAAAILDRMELLVEQDRTSGWEGMAAAVAQVGPKGMMVAQVAMVVAEEVVQQVARQEAVLAQEAVIVEQTATVMVVQQTMVRQVRQEQVHPQQPQRHLLPTINTICQQDRVRMALMEQVEEAVRVVVVVPAKVVFSVWMVPAVVAAVVAVVVKAVRLELAVSVVEEPLPSIIRGQAQAR
jgi:hypothetical protein